MTKTFSLQIKLNSRLTGKFNHREFTEAFKIVFFIKLKSLLIIKTLIKFYNVLKYFFFLFLSYSLQRFLELQIFSSITIKFVLTNFWRGAMKILYIDDLSETHYEIFRVSQFLVISRSNEKEMVHYFQKGRIHLNIIFWAFNMRTFHKNLISDLLFQIFSWIL